MNNRKCILILKTSEQRPGDLFWPIPALNGGVNQRASLSSLTLYMTSECANEIHFKACL